MTENEIADYIVRTFPATTVADAGGGRFFFNDPKQNFPFVTIVTSDEFDTASNLARPDVFRLNIDVRKETFQSLFGPKPAEGAFDFTALDQIMPHPQYGMMFWICVLNPSEATFETVRPLIAEAYALSAERYAG